MAALAAVSKGNVGWLGPLGACEALLLSYERHATNKEVISAIWNCIGTLCAYNRERFSCLGAAQYVVSSLRLHFQSGVDLGPNRESFSSLASSASFAIGRLCEPINEGTRLSSLRNRKELYSVGCCEILTIVLSKEYSDATAATNIFRAIATMSNGIHCSQVNIMI